MGISVLFSQFFVIIILLVACATLIRAKKVPHEEFDDEKVKYFASLSNINYFHEVLDHILIPRVVGTPNHTKIQNYIIGELKSLDWIIKVDEFKGETPVFGELTFRNIIATINPNAEKFLILACHYESKYFQNIEFVGATDSAVPCSMILNLAKVMKEEFDKLKSREDISIRLIFFDGEEAFLEWSANDSIYGAKHLAEKWQNSYVRTSDNKTVTNLSRIDIFVLLDLIGTSNPQFYSYFKNTYEWYERLMRAESNLAKLRLLENLGVNAYFNKLSLPHYIEDDHVPFLEKGVPILHLIPVPYPKEWHTERDNHEIVDIKTVEDINRILRIFVAEYLYRGKPKNDSLSNSTYSIVDSVYSGMLLLMSGLRFMFNLR